MTTSEKEILTKLIEDLYCYVSELKTFRDGTWGYNRASVGIDNTYKELLSVIKCSDTAVVYAALSRLVELKDYKDTHGKDLAYEAAQKLAWKQAREILEGVTSV